MRTIMATLIMALLLAPPGRADNAFKEGGKEIGQGFKKMGKETGKAFKEGGKEVGHGFREMGRGIRKFFKGE